MLVKEAQVIGRSFNNNPNKRFLQNYRRDFISKIPTLTFLDDRKVDDLERKTSPQSCSQCSSKSPQAIHLDGTSRQSF